VKRIPIRAGTPCDQWNLEWEKTSCAGRGWAVTVAAGAAGRFLTHLASLPIWKGKRPITIRGPLHLQYNNNDDDFLVRELVEEGHSLAGHRSGSISWAMEIWCLFGPPKYGEKRFGLQLRAAPKAAIRFLPFATPARRSAIGMTPKREHSSSNLSLVLRDLSQSIPKRE
jgi:hypothetical protein